MVETEDNFRDQVMRALRRWVAAQDTAGQVAMVNLDVSTPWVPDQDFEDAEPVVLYELPSLELTQVLDEDASARVGKTLEGTQDGGIRYSASRMAYLAGPRYHVHPAGHGLDEPLVSAELFTEVARLACAAADLVSDSGRALGKGMATGRLVESGVDGTRGPSVDVQQELAAKIDQLKTILKGDVASLAAEIEIIIGGIHDESATICAGTTDGPTLIAEVVLVYPLPRTHGPGRYHVRVYLPTPETRLVVLGDLTDNHSTSLHNGFEHVATMVRQKLLASIASDRIIWVIYESAGRYGSSSATSGERDMRWVNGLTDRQALPGLHLGPCSHEELEALAGGSVRRWHVRDYTSVRVHEMGARILRVPRQRILPGTDLTDAPADEEY